MLQLSSIFYNRKVLSLRTGGPVGFAMSPVINPNNLKIEGWYATATGERESYILPVAEVRDIIIKGIVVDDHSSLTRVEDMIRLKKTIDIAYEVIGKQVVSSGKKKLGKVADYAVNDDVMMIKKLYVNQSLLKNFTTQQLIIDRDQIVEINNKSIIVRDGSEQVRAGAQAQATA